MNDFQKFLSNDFSERLFNQAQYVTLLAEMKTAFRYFKLTVSSTLRETSDVGNLQDFVSISKHVEFMAVDSKHVKDLIEMGVPAFKIIARVEFNGRAHILPNPDHKNLAYFEICDLLSNQTSKWAKYWDSENQIAIAKSKNRFAQNRSVIVYVNGRTIANEMRKMTRLGLAGVMAYAINFDDYLGKCSFDEDTFGDFKPMQGVKLNFPKRSHSNSSLLQTINDAITVALDEIDQEEYVNNALVFKD